MDDKIQNKYFKIIAGSILVLISILWWHKSGSSNVRDEVADKTGEEIVSIVLTENGFEPRYVKIDLGTTVVFSTNVVRPFWPASNLHPSHGIYPEFDPRKPIDPYDKWSFTFNKTGTWGFHDHIRSYFNGVIYVE